MPDELKHVPAGSQYHSGAHVRMQAAAKEEALHQYRDRATETLDQLDEIRESEGAWHRWVRRRRGRPSPEVQLGPAQLQVLARWRADVDLGGGLGTSVKDVSRADGEARLLSLETLAE